MPLPQARHTDIGAREQPLTTDVFLSQQTFKQLSWTTSQLFHGFASVQTCRSSFDAAVVPIVRYTLKNTFAESFEPFSVFIPFAVKCAGVVFSLIRDRLARFTSDFLLRTVSLTRVSHHLSVTHVGFSRVPGAISAFRLEHPLSTHQRSTNFYQPDVTP